VRGRANVGDEDEGMVDGHQIHIRNRTMKPLVIALSGVRRGLCER
jgi:hypothetical protein